YTLAPFCASAIAIARPIPRLAPVTSATRPANKVVGCSLCTLILLRQCAGPFCSCRPDRTDPTVSLAKSPNHDYRAQLVKSKSDLPLAVILTSCHWPGRTTAQCTDQTEAGWLPIHRVANTQHKYLRDLPCNNCPGSPTRHAVQSSTTRNS